MPSEFVTVAKVHEMPERGGLSAQINGRSIAIFMGSDGQFFATDALCPHRGGPLIAGWVENEKVYCPLHGWQFDLRTGACRENPEKPLACYDVRAVGDEIQVRQK